MRKIISLLILIFASFNGHGKVFEYNVLSSLNPSVIPPKEQTFFVVNNNDNFSQQFEWSLISYLKDNNFKITNDSTKANIILEVNLIDVSKIKSITLPETKTVHGTIDNSNVSLTVTDPSKVETHTWKDEMHNLIIKAKVRGIFGNNNITFWEGSLKDDTEELIKNKNFVVKAIMWTFGADFSGEVKIREKDKKILNKNR